MSPTSFTVTENLTIKVRPSNKGHILYRFKNMNMHSEQATIVDEDSNRITVKRCKDEQLINFILQDKHWLLEHHGTNGPLFGTEFRIDE